MAKAKLMVFARSEVSLIVIFFLVAIFLSFTFGFRLGKSYSFSQSPYTEEDREIVEEKVAMKTPDEEKVDLARANPQKISETTVLQDTNELLAKRLNEQLAQAPKSPPGGARAPKNPLKPKKDLVGKYTIQVGSFRSLMEAEEFSKGLEVRGYRPMIERADLGPKGIWFRVGLGAFENIPMAREYIEKEGPLFAGQDYEIRLIK